MKQHRVLSKDGHTSVVVSSNSIDYVYLIDRGYNSVFEGTKIECNEYLETLNEDTDELEGTMY